MNDYRDTTNFSVARRHALPRIVPIIVALAFAFTSTFAGVNSAEATSGYTPSKASPAMSHYSSYTAYVTWATPKHGKKYNLTVKLGSKTVYNKTSTGRARYPKIQNKAGVKYSYRVIAYGSGGKKSYSSWRTFTTRSQHTTVRFASYNVCAELCPSLKSWSSGRAKAVANQIKAKLPDVVTIQEAGTSSYHMVKLRKYLLPEYQSITGAKSRYIFYRIATMSADTYNKKRGENGTFSVRANSKSKITYVPYQVLRRRSNNARVIVVDTHLTSLDSVGSDQARSGEMKLIVSKTNALRKRQSGAVTIYAGDLNSLSRRHVAGLETDYNRFRATEYLSTIGYKDSVKIAQSTYRSTYSTHNPDPGDNRAFGPSFHLDHFYVPGNVSVTGFGVDYKGLTGSNRLSDHNMIFATLVIPSV